nr:citrate synthase [Gammaproteobacteria bacterium]
TGSDRESARWETPRHDAQISLAPGASAADYMRAALSHLGPQDPFRYDLSPESVMRSAYALLPSLVAVVPLQVDATEREPHTDGTSDFESNDAELALAQALWPRLSAQPSGVAGIALLDMAMSLLADHELATSTFAVRVAGSVRADIYSSLSAGFGAVAGILHGAAGARAHQLLNDIGDADQAVRGLTAYLRDNTALPGFGHPLYPLGDPRARCLLDRLAASDAPAHRVATVFHLIELTEQRGLPAPSIDFALAGVCFAYDMVPGAPEAVFALARTAGWIAHLLEEFEATPLRFRARAHYVGDAIET